jgi:peptidoglycan hydrolase CwlO-like protein
VCAVLVIVAGGLVVWALSLQSDLNDQKDQTAAAEQQAQDASAQVDDINQAVSDLGDQLQQAGGEAQGKIQQAVDALKAKLADLRDQLTPPDSGGGSTGESGTSEPTATDAPAAAETAMPADATSTP